MKIIHALVSMVLMFSSLANACYHNHCSCCSCGHGSLGLHAHTITRTTYSVPVAPFEYSTLLKTLIAYLANSKTEFALANAPESSSSGELIIPMTTQTTTSVITGASYCSCGHSSNLETEIPISCTKTVTNFAAATYPERVVQEQFKPVENLPTDFLGRIGHWFNCNATNTLYRNGETDEYALSVQSPTQGNKLVAVKPTGHRCWLTTNQVTGLKVVLAGTLIATALGAAIYGYCQALADSHDHSCPHPMAPFAAGCIIGSLLLGTSLAILATA